MVVGVMLTMLQACGVSLFGGGDTGAPVAGVTPSASPAPLAEAPTDDEGLGSFDSDRDGIVMKTELETGLIATYKKDDTDGDGSLSAVETRAVNDRVMQESDATPVIDWNADGKVLMQEYASRWRTMFDRSDINRDGMVDAKELAGLVRARKIRPLPEPGFGDYKGKL